MGLKYYDIVKLQIPRKEMHLYNKKLQNLITIIDEIVILCTSIIHTLWTSIFAQCY